MLQFLIAGEQFYRFGITGGIVEKSSTYFIQNDPPSLSLRLCRSFTACAKTSTKKSWKGRAEVPDLLGKAVLKDENAEGILSDVGGGSGAQGNVPM